MSSGQRFSGFPATFSTSAPATVQVDQLMAWDLSTNNTRSIKRPMGSLDPVAHVVARAQPQFGMRTGDVATILDSISIINGQQFDGPSVFRLQERADGGAFLTGATHPTYRTQNGFAYINSITASQDSPDGAIVELTFLPLWNGTDPIIESVPSEDLASAPSPAFNTCHMFYAPKMNGSFIPGVIDITCNAGLTYQAAPALAGAFDTLGSITAREPTFTFRALKIDEFNSFISTGGLVGSTFEMLLQKSDPANTNGDGRVALATAEHIKISCTAGDVDIQSISVEGTQDAVAEVTIMVEGTLSVSTSSVIA